MRRFANELPLTLTKAQRVVVAEVTPHFRPRLLLEEGDQRTARFRLEELKVIHHEVSHALHFEKDGRKRNSLRHAVAVVEETMQRFFQIDAIPAAQRIYQLRIVLKDITPEIWRRIQVKYCTLSRLHEHIQLCMGWENYHLYSFQIGAVEYADLDLVEEFYGQDAREIRLSEVVPKDGHRCQFLYVYDFGDDWRHEVLFEGCMTADPNRPYPVCLEGERACPPEDVGGVGGFEEYLAALSNPHHDEHESFLQWRGHFDPEEFSTGAVMKRMQRRR
jgi:hypothetical protein